MRQFRLVGIKQGRSEEMRDIRRILDGVVVDNDVKIVVLKSAPEVVGPDANNRQSGQDRRQTPKDKIFGPLRSML